MIEDRKTRGSLLLRPLAVLCVFGITGAYAGDDPVTVSAQGDVIKLSIEGTNEVEVDTTTLWKAPYSDNHYLKVKNANEAFLDNANMPIATISGRELISRNQMIAMQSPAAIADKMIQESTLGSYSNFTGILHSILGGRIPTNAVVSNTDNLFDQSRWLASNDDDAVDYLGQDEDNDNDSYGSRIAEGARSAARGPWITILQITGHYFDQDPMNDLAGFKSSGYGLHGALLKPVGTQGVVGAYAAWQNLSADIRHSDGEVEVGTFRLGPAFAWGMGAAHLEGILTYSRSKVKNKANGFSGEYKAGQWDTYLRGAIDIDMETVARGLSLTPELHLLYTSQGRDSFNWVYDEQIKEADSKGWITRVGGTLGYDRLQFEQPLELKLSVGWQYNQFTTEKLQTSSGKSANQSNYDKHAMYYSAGIDARLNESLNLSLGYAGTWSSNALGHYLQAGMEFRF